MRNIVPFTNTYRWCRTEFFYLRRRNRSDERFSWGIGL